MLQMTFLMAGCGADGRVGTFTPTGSAQIHNPSRTVSLGGLAESSPEATLHTSTTQADGTLVNRSTPSLAPRRTNTPAATSTPTSTPPIPLVSLLRQTGGVYSTWQDDILDIRFEIPLQWGSIEARILPGERGLAYIYSFPDMQESQPKALAAGGISTDYLMGRGGTWSDFRGYGQSDENRMCAASYRSPAICKQVQPGVAFSIDFPDAQYICEPGPGSIGAPLAFVEISLPDNPHINGFVFVSEFLSPELADEIASARRYFLGNQGVSPAEKCDPESQAAFDEWMAGFARRIESGDVDQETALSLSRLEHLAHSIVLRIEK